MKMKGKKKAKDTKKRKRTSSIQTTNDTTTISVGDTERWGLDVTELQARKQANLVRFGNNTAKRSSGITCKHLPSHGIVVDNTGMTAEHLAEFSKPLVGTSKALEKNFLRLTTEPRVEDVRPQVVLKRAMKMVKRRWKNEQVDYKWACEQLKAIRQDLSVQNVRNDITVDVYQTHGEFFFSIFSLSFGGHFRTSNSTSIFLLPVFYCYPRFYSSPPTTGWQNSSACS